jgi:membrane protein implicated in regulation of membrane protease activity
MRRATLLLLVTFFPLSLPLYALGRRIASKKEKTPGRPRKRLKKVKRLVTEGETDIFHRRGERWEQDYIW